MAHGTVCIEYHDSSGKREGRRENNKIEVVNNFTLSICLCVCVDEHWESGKSLSEQIFESVAMISIQWRNEIYDGNCCLATAKKSNRWRRVCRLSFLPLQCQHWLRLSSYHNFMHFFTWLVLFLPFNSFPFSVTAMLLLCIQIVRPLSLSLSTLFIFDNFKWDRKKLKNKRFGNRFCLTLWILFQFRFVHSFYHLFFFFIWGQK